MNHYGGGMDDDLAGEEQMDRERDARDEQAERDAADSWPCTRCGVKGWHSCHD